MFRFHSYSRESVEISFEHEPFLLTKTGDLRLKCSIELLQRRKLVDRAILISSIFPSPENRVRSQTPVSQRPISTLWYISMRWAQSLLDWRFFPSQWRPSCGDFEFHTPRPTQRIYRKDRGSREFQSLSISLPRKNRTILRNKVYLCTCTYKCLVCDHLLYGSPEQVSGRVVHVNKIIGIIR